MLYHNIVNIYIGKYYNNVTIYYFIYNIHNNNLLLYYIIAEAIYHQKYSSSKIVKSNVKNRINEYFLLPKRKRTRYEKS